MDQSFSSRKRERWAETSYVFQVGNGSFSNEISVKDYYKVADMWGEVD